MTTFDVDWKPYCSLEYVDSSYKPTRAFFSVDICINNFYKKIICQKSVQSLKRTENNGNSPKWVEQESFNFT